MQSNKLSWDKQIKKIASIKKFEKRQAAYQQMIVDYPLNKNQIRYRQAVDLLEHKKYNQSLDILEDLDVIWSDTIKEKESFDFFLGYNYMALARYNESVLALKKVVNDYAPSTITNTAKSYLAFVFDQLGEYDKAIKIMNKLLQQSKNDDLKIHYYSIQASTFRKMEKYEQAKKLIRLGMNLADSEAKKQMLRQKLAQIYLSEGAYEKAVHLYREILKSPEADRKTALNNLAQTLIQLKDPMAKKYLDEVMNYHKSSVKGAYCSSKSISYQNFAEYYYNEIQYETARTYIDSAIFNKAYPEAVRGTPTNYKLDLFKIDDKLSLLEFLEVKFKILQQQNSAEVLENLALMDTVIQSIRIEKFDDETKFFQQRKLSRIYDDAFRYFIRVDEQEHAYACMQKSKSGLLLESIEADLHQHLIPTDVRQSMKVLEEGDTLVPLSSEEQYFRESALLNQIKSDYPAYYYARFAETSLSSKQVQDMCAKDQLIIDYYLLDSILHVFYIDRKHGMKHQTKKLDADWYFKIKYIASAVANNPSLNNEKKLIESLHGLVDDLLPVNFDNYKRFTIIPHGILNQINLETLIVDPEANCPYFICDKEIVYSNSVAFIDHVARRNTMPTKMKAMVFAPHNSCSEDPDCLEYGALECSKIRESFDYDYYDNIASSHFMDTFSRYNVHHILTHGKYLKKDVNLSYLSLGKTHDPLKLQDVFKHFTPSKLVTLSACESNQGTEQKGEGVLSLAYAFQRAGSASLVASSHAIPDKVSAMIMSDFYKYLSTGMRKSEALAKAKRLYLNKLKPNNQNHPFYWSGFRMIGDDSPVLNSVEKTFMTTIYQFLAFILFVCVILFIRSRI